VAALEGWGGPPQTPPEYARGRTPETRLGCVWNAVDIDSLVNNHLYSFIFFLIFRGPRALSEIEPGWGSKGEDLLPFTFGWVAENLRTVGYE
jgi:hypothetical protein